MAAFPSKTLPAAGALALLAGLAVAPAALAQQMSSNAASFNAGYGRVSGQENRGVDYGTRDSSGNRLIVDGIIQSGETQSAFSRIDGGVFGGSTGVGAGGSSTAIGNNLVVITQGNWNTVIVTSVQTNTGDVTAGSTANGGD
ncbi:MAG TPA: holdfast anchoring protein HfaA [Caulobacter sp.]|nr:holdfast anchoring protein HfaA [Caulobacter sp.]